MWTSEEQHDNSTAWRNVKHQFLHSSILEKNINVHNLSFSHFVLLVFNSRKDFLEQSYALI